LNLLLRMVFAASVVERDFRSFKHLNDKPIYVRVFNRAASVCNLVLVLSLKASMNYLLGITHHR
jgi:hypothetical protein